MSATPVYLDFELAIIDLGGGRYRASVEEMPLGDSQPDVSHEFTLPFSDDELSRVLGILSGRVSVSEAERARQARTFGETLFRTVFAGPVYTVYFSSRDRARTAQGLRVKLSLDRAGALASLPWEFLRDPAVDYLALSRATPLVRYPRRLVIRSRPAFTPPLRVLVLVSAPTDMPPVDVEGEWANLLAATERLRARGLVEVERLEDASLRTLQQVLRGDEYHVFHYIGHSTFDPVSGQGRLVLEDSLGEDTAFPVGGEDLARELSEENTIRLVVLNSCQSAVERRDDPFAGISSSLVARGIPAVVAMQFTISEQATRVFSEELYRAVADGLPVDAAVSEARRAVSHAVSGIEWATPVLFMRAPDGRLFDVRQAAAESPSRRVSWWRAGVTLGVAAVAVALIVLIYLLVTGNEPDGPAVPDVDITIDEIDVIPSRPIPGERVAVIVKISNTGEREIGPFEYEFREDVLDSTPSVVGEITGLGPGSTETLFIPFYYTWWGAFVSELRVDVTSAVPETDEFNNILRNPVVTSSAPLVLNLEAMPNGVTFDESAPLAESVFAPWGLAWEAVPPDAPGCEDAVPWIIVETDGVFMSTGKPGDPAQCTDGGLIVSSERGLVGGVGVTFAVEQASEYALAALDGQGAEVDLVSEAFDPGNREMLSASLEIGSSLASRLEIAQAVLPRADGARTRIAEIMLYESSGRMGAFR